MNLELLKVYAMSFISTQYFFGGDDPMSGFDCSGLVCELLRASGVLPWNYRTNAQGLYNALKTKGVPCDPCLGAIAFYGKSLTEIDHVSFCVDSYSMIEAGGGNAKTTNPAMASSQNAFVRIRPIKFRKDFLCTVKPVE